MNPFHPIITPRGAVTVADDQRSGLRRRSRRMIAIGLFVGLPGAVSGCGETYIDTSVTVPPTGVVSTQPAVTYDTAAPLPALLDQIKVLMSNLDERILDEDHPKEVLAAIDSLWAAARPQVESSNPDEADDIDQAIKLAHSGVEQRRPADASKGYKIYLGLLKHYGRA